MITDDLRSIYKELGGTEDLVGCTKFEIIKKITVLQGGDDGNLTNMNEGYKLWDSLI